MGVAADEQRAVEALLAPVLADRLRRGQDVRLVERRLQARPAVPRGAEGHLLVDVLRVGLPRVVRRHEGGDVDEVRGLGELSGTGRVHGADPRQSVGCTTAWVSGRSHGGTSPTHCSSGYPQGYRREHDHHHEAARGAGRGNGRHHGRQQAPPRPAHRGLDHHRRRPRRHPRLPAGLPVHGLRHEQPRAGASPQAALHQQGRRRRARPRSTGSTREARVVHLADGRDLPYDQLVIATGTTPRPDQIPGTLGPQWHHEVGEFYTYEGALALRDRLAAFTGGRLVVHITEMPIKCPVAPLEFTFLADDFLTKRGLRDRTEIVYVTPLDGAFTKPVASEAPRLDARGEGRHRRARLHDRADRPGRGR